MKLNKKNAEVFFPDGKNDLKRTTHLCIAAHHDDIELMAYHGVVNCFGKKDKWFTGVVTTDGAGSPRTDLYADYSDDDMKAVRHIEQKKAAFVGEYGAQFMLQYSSKEVKDPNNQEVVDEFVRILKETAPEVVYTHNPADKHDTHVSVFLRLIAALRKLDKSERPKKVYGCEVWRDLDWMCDNEKEVFDVSGHKNLAMSLIGLFDSQIAGGKRYDLACDGRRTANATYFESHGVDSSDRLNYGIDLTPLMEDKDLDVFEYIDGYIKRFSKEVQDRLSKLS